jgi:hypothetical protein
MTISCADCQRYRMHIQILRDRNAELELRLEGARQQERQADLQEPGCELSLPPESAAAPVHEGEEDNHA